MSIEQNKALIRGCIHELYNGQRLEVIDELLAPEFVNHTVVPGIAPGREGVKEFFAYAFSAFPDAQYTVEALVAEGDMVVVRWTCTATHKGEFAGIPPTGKQVTFRGIEMGRVIDGRATEWWDQIDMLSVLQQLGVAILPG